MGFGVTVESNIDVPKHMKNIKNDEFWIFAGATAHRLMVPYIPMQTGVLASTTAIKTDKYERGANKGKFKKLPNKQIMELAHTNIKAEGTTATIEFTAPYAHRMYTGNFNFRKDKHPMATGEWDKAAFGPKLPNLVKSMQNYIDSGRLNLNG